MKMAKNIPAKVFPVLFLALSLTIMCFPAAAVYENKLPCDVNEDDVITEAELSDAILDYMLGEGGNSLDDVGDAAYIYTNWEGEPLTITDHYNSREVTLYRPVERIGLCSTPSVRIVASLGAADKVVGVYQNIKDDDGLIVTHAYDELRDLPALGSGSTPNAEAVIAVEPDVVFYSAASKAALLQDDTGVPVVALNATFGYDFEDPTATYDVWRLAGEILGEEERAEELIDYAGDKIDTVESVTSSMSSGERLDAYIATGGTNGIVYCAPIYYALEAAGGNNVATGLPAKWGSAEVTKEQIIAWDPDVIFIRYYSIGQSMTNDSVYDDTALSGVAAVKNSRVYYIRGSSNGMDPAIAIADACRMARLMYPDTFSGLDVEAEGNAIYREFYGKDDLYTDMLDDFGVFDRWD
jgi:ABC-type Fe3+-hydroxamate transport system substrate-binding protein